MCVYIYIYMYTYIQALWRLKVPRARGKPRLKKSGAEDLWLRTARKHIYIYI